MSFLHLKAAGLLSLGMCIFAVLSTPSSPEVEMYSVTAKPVNGTIQVVTCGGEDSLLLPTLRPSSSSCELHVDKVNRIDIQVHTLIYVCAEPQIHFH